MIDKVRETIRKYKMIQKGDKILVALSGGPDSLSLVYLLTELKKELKFKLYLAYLDHSLRPEAKAEVSYLKQVSKRLKIPLNLAKRDIPKIAKEEGGSLETVARKVRYQFLIKTAKKLKANKIALGHNQNDQVETFLLNFLRGAGPRGLSGMPAKRRVGQFKNGKGIFIIRPLIRIFRKEIMSYLNKKRIRPLFDASNLVPLYTRNKIRWRLLPYLRREFNPQINEGIAKLTQIFEEENVFWENYLKQILKDIVVRKNQKGICLDIKKLLTQPEAVQSRVIQEVLRQFLGRLEGITYDHIKAIRNLSHKGGGWKILTLPQGLQVVKDYGKLIIKRKEAEPDYSFAFPVRTPGKNLFLELSSQLEIHSRNYNKKEIKKLLNRLRLLPLGERFKVILDRDKLKFSLLIRNRRLGDRFQPLGLKKGYPKLKDYFINKKISFLERKKIPLLIDSWGRIAWVIGFEIADWSKVTEKTKRVLELKYRLNV